MEKFRNELINHYTDLLRFKDDSYYYYRLKINYLNFDFSKNVNLRKSNVFKLNDKISFFLYFKILIQDFISNSLDESSVSLIFSSDFDNNNFISILFTKYGSDIELKLDLGVYYDLHATKIALIDLNEEFHTEYSDDSVIIHTDEDNFENVVYSLLNKIKFILGNIYLFNLSLFKNGVIEDSNIFYLEEIENVFNVRKNSIIEELSESEVKKYKIKEGFK
ncbi:hypothetical protein CPT_MarsHill_105 [Staphylococcus phage MarsHill]|nr:hypothetical protein CPT_MarsHill_105 [Staphylococcus phage MarsHill]QQO92760.1 hypothetical protein CPT_Madawaska_105 [Staphylococcus phage Madawaska]